MHNIYFDKSELKHLGNNVIIGKSVRIRKPNETKIDKNSKLFLSLVIMGGLIILYSTYKVYESIKGI